MDFSEWNSLPPNCVKLGLSVHMDLEAVRCLPNLTPIWKLLSVHLTFNADGNFTVTYSFLNYFSIPSIGLKLSNTAQTLNSKHTKLNAVDFQLGEM